MNKKNKKNNGPLQELATIIHNEAYKKFVDKKTTIFLCGASRDNEDSIRAQLEGALIESFYYHAKYQFVYPEDLYGDLLVGSGRHDLISLENILAESVDAIIIIIESWGAVAELGMFSSNDRLRKKIICVIDEKFKKAKSFIQFGPVRLMKDTREGKVLYLDFQNIGLSIRRIHQYVNDVSKISEKTSGVVNPLQAHVFVLMCIFLLEPVPKDMMAKLVMYSAEVDQQAAEALSTTAASELIKRKQVTYSTEGYRLTDLGLNEFKNINLTGVKKYTFDIKDMDEIRVRILNWKTRNKQLDFSKNLLHNNH